jgi:tetratricopeptide (TPR) repeat protein
MAGDAEKGVRLTLQGLTMATSDRDRISGWANLCAGYVMLDRLDDALVYCDQAIEADPGHWHALSNRALIYIFRAEYDLAASDVARAEAIVPHARIPRQVKTMLRNALNPVVPTVTIDDRRKPPRPDSDD